MFERNEPEISQIIEEGLEAVLSGKTSMEEALQQHPEIAPVLRRELEAALWLQSRCEQVQSRPGFMAASKKRVVERVIQEARHRGAKRSTFLSFSWPVKRYAYQWAAALVIAVLLLSSLGGGVSLANHALPGQQLYSLKRLGEGVSYFLASDEIRQVSLNIQFSQERLVEVRALIASGDLSLVKTTLDDFKNGVSQAMALLHGMDDTASAEKMAAAQQLTENFSEQAKQLDEMSTSVPEDLRANLEEAHDLSLSSATIALDVLVEMNDLLVTSTPTGTLNSTNTPTNTPTLKNSATPRATKTPEPELRKPESRATLTPTPVNGQKITRTPRPTNPNRPADPSGSNKGNPDPKDSKPDKDDKPPKSDQNEK